jgi:hypothetical protein
MITEGKHLENEGIKKLKVLQPKDPQRLIRKKYNVVHLLCYIKI